MFHLAILIGVSFSSFDLARDGRLSLFFDRLVAPMHRPLRLTFQIVVFMNLFSFHPAERLVLVLSLARVALPCAIMFSSCALIFLGCQTFF